MQSRGESVDDDADCVVEPFSRQTVCAICWQHVPSLKCLPFGCEKRSHATRRCSSLLITQVPEDALARIDRGAYVAARTAAIAEIVGGVLTPASASVDGGPPSGGGARREPPGGATTARVRVEALLARARSRNAAGAPRETMPTTSAAVFLFSCHQVLFETIPSALASLLTCPTAKQISRASPAGCAGQTRPAAGDAAEAASAAAAAPPSSKGRRLFLFNEQFVVKPPRSAARFAWHTDEQEQLGMCLRPPDAPYLVRSLLTPPRKVPP